MIIDSHCHAGKGDGLSGPWDTNAPLGKYLEYADKYNISRTVLFSVFHSDYAKANYNVAKIVSSNRNKFYGFAFVHALRDAGRIFPLISKAIVGYQFCGIKVHRYDASISREICETAKYFSLPVLYDVMGEISQVYLIANEYPDVNFIIPHLGSFADDWRAQKTFIDPLKRFPNIFTDTSGIRRFDLLSEALSRAGASKILFGSDGPWLHPGVELEKIYALNPSSKELNMILSENFQKLTGNTKRTNSKENDDMLRLSGFYKNNSGQTNYRDPWERK